MAVESVNQTQSLYFAAVQTAKQEALKAQKKQKTEKLKSKLFSSALQKSQEEFELLSAGFPKEIAGMSTEDAIIYLKDAADIAAETLKSNQIPQNFSEYRKKVSQFMRYIVKNNIEIKHKIYGNKETESYVTFPKQNKPLGLQLFGYDPDNIAKAAKIVLDKNPNFNFIDVNMACPVLKVTKTGAGSSLLKDPEKCGQIIRKLKQITDLPISAKIRLGWDDKSINYLDVIHELEDAGVDFIALHARTKKDLYYGEARMEIIKDLQKKMRVPLIISGNIFTFLLHMHKLLPCELLIKVLRLY